MTTITAKVNVTKHALERWCERILNMIDSKEIALYINSNRDKLTNDINTTLQFGEFIYKGQLGNDNITRHYYISGDIVLITNTDNNAVITVYKVDLGFTPELNTQVRKGLIQEIHKLANERDELEFQALEEVEKKTFEISNIDDQMLILQKQMDELKLQKKVLSEEVKSLNSKSKYVNHELSKYVLMLVNSIEYKKDMQTV